MPNGSNTILLHRLLSSGCGSRDAYPARRTVTSSHMTNSAQEGGAIQNHTTYYDMAWHGITISLGMRSSVNMNMTRCCTICGHLSYSSSRLASRVW